MGPSRDPLDCVGVCVSVGVCNQLPYFVVSKHKQREYHKHSLSLASPWFTFPVGMALSFIRVAQINLVEFESRLEHAVPLGKNSEEKQKEKCFSK